MTQPSVRIENLSKRYVLGRRQPYATLRDTVSQLFRAKGQAAPTAEPSDQGTKELWALRDLSFDVRQGEAFGVIGRNGAGKSTLLKVLSRIVEPSSGKVELRGRVGSLLEVGTGFHPELSGRENIYLNGAILGMSRDEIRRKFDEIIAFAEIEDFVDTPVKHYSSGMYTRLAFAVAAHLEPEILIVDEVLAVGDVAFQKKCLGKLGDVARGGRTVLFVSHQMNTMRRLCDRCAWLDAGKLRMMGPAATVIGAYESSLTRATFRAERDGAQQEATFITWRVLDDASGEPNVLTGFGPFVFSLRVQVSRPLKRAVHGIALWNADNQLIWAWSKHDFELKEGISELRYRLPMLPIKPGAYHWQVSLFDENRQLEVAFLPPDLIVSTPPLGHPRDEWAGLLNMPCEFDVRAAEAERTPPAVAEVAEG